MKTKSNPKAFTLIEVVMALAVLSIGLVGIINLASLNLRTSLDSRDEIVAAALAQDGLELVFNIKDNNKINSVADFQYFPAANSNTCRIDRTYVYAPAGGTAINCTPVGSFYQLNYNAGAGFVHTGGLTGTKFFRRIKINTVDGNRVVTVYVTWNRIAPTNSMVSAADCKTTCNLKTKCTCAQMTLTAN